MNSLFLIPARAGSKGVPNKNIRLLGGEPLIVHSIRQALLAAPSAADVVVSTDSEEIAGIARNAGASVPFLRPSVLASDTASSRDVILHAADALPGYDSVVLLQPTSPFRNPDDIRKAMEIFESERPDMVVSVRHAIANPYYDAFETDREGRLKISKGHGRYTRRQDAPEVWQFDGSIYVINLDSLRKYDSLATMPRILPLVNSSRYNIDIDSETDFRLAELLINS